MNIIQKCLTRKKDSNIITTVKNETEKKTWKRKTLKRLY